MHIGILQCGHTAPRVIARHGDYAAMMARLLDAPGRRFSTWDVCDGRFPNGPGAADAWMLSGSPLAVYDDAGFIAPLEDLIRAIVAAGRPLVGICFGHQLIAQALGGQVARHPGGWRLGPQPYRIEGTDTPVRLHAWHRDQVTRPPPGARVIASGPDCAIAGLALDEHVLSLQAHPEFDDGVIADLIAARGGSAGYETAPLEAAAAALGTPTDRAWAAARLGRHLAGAVTDAAS